MKRAYFSERTKLTFASEQPITITDPLLGKLEFRADPSVAFVDFTLSHAYPVRTNKDQTTIFPQVVANSFQSLRWKVFNLAHLMRSYDPQRNPRDRILGCVVAVEFPEMPAGGWPLDLAREQAPGIRAVAVMFKAAEDVSEILRTWAAGTTPWGNEWTVSMENQHLLEECGFLVRGETGVEAFAAATPPAVKKIGFTYVPVMDAPLELLRCLNNEQDDQKDADISTRIKRDFKGQETLLGIGGVAGRIHYSGVGITPYGKEEEATVGRMLASGGLLDGDVAGLPDVFAPLRRLLAAAAQHTKK